MSEREGTWARAMLDRKSLPPFVGEIYRHYKTGKLYVVTGRSIMEDTMEQLVTYSSIDRTEIGVTRKVSVFFAFVEGEVRRYTKVTNEDLVQDAAKKGFNS